MKHVLHLTSLLILNIFISAVQSADFITRWDLSKTGTAGNTSISFLTTNAAGSVSYSWQEISPGSNSGSGSFAAGTAASRSITGLPANSIIELRVAPTNLQRFYIAFGTDKLRLTDIKQWGTVSWTSMEDMFNGCNNLTATAVDIPDLSNVSSMNRMFNLCITLNGPTNIGNWNTFAITSMNRLFSNATVFNQNIGAWNTANVTDMGYMFNAAQAFNQNIGSWNTGKVTNMAYMFNSAQAFNQNIGGWNTANVTNMGFMFFGCNAFNQNIGSWNIIKVTTMESMFQSAMVFNQNIGNWVTDNVTSMRNLFNGAFAFNQNIGNWNTAKVSTMNGIFYGAAAFNQNIGNWNTASVTDLTNAFRSTIFNQNIGSWNTANVVAMSNIFFSANSFNQDISNWNTSKVVDMSNAFLGATAFNQNIGNWNTASVTNMRSMFSGATAFNQNLAKWILNPNVNMASMLNNCGMDCDNYSLTLAGWATASNATARTLGATGRTYGTNITALRSILTTPTSSGGKGWTITGDAVSTGTCGPSVFYSKSTGNLDDLATWGANTDGTGTNPLNFTTANQVFCIRNRSSAGIAAAWSVSGTNSLVIVGDGSTAITFSTGSNTINGSFKVTNNATIVLESNTSGLDIMSENGGTISYNGSSAQTVMAKFGYHHLIISGSSTKTLNGNMVVLGNLTLSNKLVLGLYNLSISGTISGAGSSNYIQTNSTGTLSKSLTAGSTFSFPVGNSAYNPASITNNTGAADVFSMRVLDEVYYAGTSGRVATEPRVMRTWVIGKNNPNAGSGVNFVFNWNAGEETPGITTYKLYQYDGSAWQRQSGTTTTAGNSLTYTGYTGSFSPFAIGDDNILLPVTWISTQCKRVDAGSIEFKWVVTGGLNDSFFEVQRRTKSGDFNVIGRVKAASRSNSINQYSFVDLTASGLTTVYQIRLISEGGRTSTSNSCIVPAFWGSEGERISVYPNPAESVINVVLSNQAINYGYILYNHSGQRIKQGFLSTRSPVISLTSVKTGLYLLQIQSKSGLHSEKVWVK